MTKEKSERWKQTRMKALEAANAQRKAAGETSKQHLGALVSTPRGAAMTQAQLAVELGISKSYVQKLAQQANLRRYRKSDNDTLECLLQTASILSGFSIATILGREGAQGVRRSVWLVAHDKGVSYEEIAKRFGRDASWVREASDAILRLYDDGYTPAIEIIDALGEAV